MNLKPGDKVICIYSTQVSHLEMHREYTVERQLGVWVYLKELPNRYAIERFQLSKEKGIAK